jgi:hypothetical protein
VIFVDSQLNGGSPGAAALTIDAKTSLTLQNVGVAGYGKVLVQGGDKGLANTVPFYASGTTVRHPADSATVLELPVEETPDHLFTPYNASTWANVTAYGAVPGDNKSDSQAVQAAIDSGKEVIWFPLGFYHLDSTVIVRNKAKLLISGYAIIKPTAGFWSQSGTPTMFRISSSLPAVELRGLYWQELNAANKQFQLVHHASASTLVLRDLMMGNGNSGYGFAYVNAVGSGKLFVEDVCGVLNIANPTSAWARQLNPEAVITNLRNSGGKLWVLGLKTEKNQTLVQTTNHGQTEILGGLAYSSLVVPTNRPAFDVTDSQLAVKSFATTAYGADKNYTVMVKHTHKGVTTTLSRGSFRSRGLGTHIDHYRGNSAP